MLLRGSSGDGYGGPLLLLCDARPKNGRMVTGCCDGDGDAVGKNKKKIKKWSVDFY